ncbi:MAG: NUDIX hydrolase [Parcubacteria group bacterium]
MGKGSVQYGALPWRIADGELQVLLITTRRTRRWMIPKGWPMDDRAPHEAAAQEAWEEAGLRGAVGAEPVGAFHYDKVRKSGEVKRLRVDVFPLAVTHEALSWPEAHERERRWFPQSAAADAVREPELKALLAGFRR